MGGICSAPKQPKSTRRRSAGNAAGRWHSFEDDALLPCQAFSTFNDDDELVAVCRRAATAAKPMGAERVPPLSISTRVEYAAIPSGMEQDVFGIVTVQASAAPEPQDTSKDRQPLDLVCVLDVSGSMFGEKLALVQQAIQFLIKESQPQDRVSIVAFNHGASRVLRLCRMEASGKAQASEAVQQLTSDGGTHIPGGVEVALEVMERRRQRNPVSAILLLTDGQDGSDSRTWTSLIARTQNAGCSLYAFGFGADHDARLLTEVAELAQTPFTYVEDVDQIGAAFAGAIGGLVSVAAQQVEVSLDCRVQLKATHTPFPSSQQGRLTTVKIPDVLAGERRDILVELSVPAYHGGSDYLLMLDASAKYWDLAAEQEVQTAVAHMLLHRTDEPQPETEPDEEVSKQRHRWEVTETLKAASSHGDAGQFEQAQALLTAHQARLLSGRKSAMSEALAVELHDASDRLQSRSSWEDGGRADLGDKRQMHLMQRSTNCSISKKSRGSSKAMYLTSVQSSWITKSSSA